MSSQPDAQLPKPKRAPRKRGQAQGITSTTLQVAGPMLGVFNPALGVMTAVGAAIAQQTLGRSQEKRVFDLAKDLTELVGTLDEGRLGDDNLVHALLMTQETIRKTRSRPMRKRLAQLFAGFYNAARPEDIDAFEHAHRVLAELDPREYWLLTIIYEFERELEQRGQPPKDITEKWDTVAAAIKERTGIPQEQLPGHLARLNRTGLFHMALGVYGGNPDNRGRLTPYAYEFIHELELSS